MPEVGSEVGPLISIIPRGPGPNCIKHNFSDYDQGNVCNARPGGYTIRSFLSFRESGT